MKKVSLIVGVISLAVVLAGCGSAPKSVDPQASRRQAIANLAPIRTIPGPRPAWVDETPKDAVLQYFIGVSQRYATDRDARNNAQEDGRKQLVDYYGTLMVNKGREFVATLGISTDVFSPQTAGQQLNERISQNLAQALGNPTYYTEVYFDDAVGREAFVAYARMEIDKSLVARTIDNYGRENAADLQKKAAAEQDKVRRQQLEETAKFFGGNLSSTLGF